MDFWVDACRILLDLNADAVARSMHVDHKDSLFNDISLVGATQAPSRFPTKELTDQTDTRQTETRTRQSVTTLAY